MFIIICFKTCTNVFFYRVAPKKEVAPLSISPLPNADWRANAKHKKELYVPVRAQQPVGESKPEVLDQSQSTFGLQIQKKTVIQTHDQDMNETETVTIEQTQEQVQKSLEERAVEAIIKGNVYKSRWYLIQVLT